MIRPWHRAALALAVAFAAAGVVLVVTQSREARLDADFTIAYSAGTLLREGHFQAPYQPAQLAATIHRVAPQSTISILPFNEPLAAVSPHALLSLLPIEVAFRVWQVVLVLLLLASLVLLQRAVAAGARALALGALGLLAWVPTWATLTEGQVTPLVLLGAVLIIALLGSGDDSAWRPIAVGGLAGALLAVKPQYLPAYLLVLVAARRWRPLLAAGAAGAAVVLSPLIGGGATMLAMIHNALVVNEPVGSRANEAWIGLLPASIPPSVATTATVVFAAGVAAALAWVAWRRSLQPLPFTALAGTLALLASPHALPHDLLLLTVPAWLARALFQSGVLPNPVAAIMAVDLALLVDLRGGGVALAPLVVTVVLVWMAWAFRRRGRERHRPPLALSA